MTELAPQERAESLKDNVAKGPDVADLDQFIAKGVAPIGRLKVGGTHVAGAIEHVGLKVIPSQEIASSPFP